MKVAISGASSFTALWIAQEFKNQGWDVLATCPGKKADYLGLKYKRLNLLSKFADISFEVNSTDGSMSEWISRTNFNIWVHHHHYMTDFRLPNYDEDQADAVGIHSLSTIIESLKKEDKRIIFSGSYFEGGITPYARSKARVWKKLRDLCGKTLGLSKVVIPDSIGPFENEDRLIPHLIELSTKQHKFLLKTPGTVNDHLPVRVLAKQYVKTAESLLNGHAEICCPSGRQVNNRAWVEEVLSEFVEKRLKLNRCPVEFGNEVGQNYRNNEPRIVDWNAEWDFYATMYKENRDL